MKESKSILLTGGAGFIGSHLVKRLLKNYPNYRIFNLDSLTYASNLNNLKECEFFSNYKFVKGDIIDFNFLKEQFKSNFFDIIIHLAAESHVDNSIRNPLTFASTNIQGTLNLLEIGPGTGALTEFLDDENIHLVAYELDQESTLYLNKKFPNLKVFNQDILNVNWTKIFETNFSVTGNFPYNISSQIMFKIFEYRNTIDQMVGMFQKK